MEKVILVLEDSLACQRIAAESLKMVGDVKLVASLQEAREFLGKNSPDVVVMDMHLPDGDGMQMLTELHNTMAKREIPVLFVSGDADISKKVAAFFSGAEDYIVKPYAPLELRVRVERVLKGYQVSELFTDDKLNLLLDLFKYKAFHLKDKNKVEIPLTPHEFKLLHLFVKNLDRVYSRQQIIDKVWGAEIFISPRTVDTHISGLRRKIAGLPIALKSVRSEGYKAELCDVGDLQTAPTAVDKSAPEAA